MITYLFLTIIITLVGIIFSMFPTIEELPWGLDSVLSDGVAGYKEIAEVFPPMETMMTIFLIYLGFKIALILLKFFLGSRTPNA